MVGESGEVAVHRGKEDVRTRAGDGRTSEVNVKVHQGSVLSMLLWMLCCWEVRGESPWEVLNAYKLVLMVQTREKLSAKMVAWRSSLAPKGLKVNVERPR